MLPSVAVMFPGWGSVFSREGTEAWGQSNSVAGKQMWVPWTAALDPGPEVAEKPPRSLPCRDQWRRRGCRARRVESGRSWLLLQQEPPCVSQAPPALPPLSDHTAPCPRARTPNVAVGVGGLPALPLLRLLFQRTAHPLGAQPAGGPAQGGLPQSGLPEGGLSQGGLSQRRPAGLPLRGRLPSDRSLQRRLGRSSPWCRGEAQTCSYKQHHSCRTPSLSLECTGIHAFGHACVYTPTSSHTHTHKSPCVTSAPSAPAHPQGRPLSPDSAPCHPHPTLWGQQVPARPFWPEATVMSILRDLKLPEAAGRGSECLALFVPGMAADHKGPGQL